MKPKFNRLRSFLKILVDILEIYVPMFFMFSLFIVFLIGIFSRYFFLPLSWNMELSLVLYLWVALFGCLYAQRKERHVVFSLVYDRLSPNVQRIFRLIGNSLLAFSFLYVLKPSYNYIKFMRIRSTNVLQIPLNLVYTPFLIFLVVMSIRFIMLIIRDIREIISERQLPETH